MKKLIGAVLLIVTFTWSIFAMDVFVSKFVVLEEDKANAYSRIIDNTYSPFLERNTMDNAFQVKLWNIRNTLVTYLNTNTTTDTIFYALEYLIFRIDETLATTVFSTPTTTTTIITTIPSSSNTNTSNVTIPQAETDIVTNTSVQNNDLSMNTQESNPTPIVTTQQPTLNTSQYYEWDKNILAWTTSWPVFKYELVSSLEWALIEDLAFLANAQNLERSIESIQLYNEKGILIDKQRPNNNVINFRNIDREIPKGQSDLYVVIESKKIWLNSSAPQQLSFDLNLDIQEAKWIISWRDLWIMVDDWNETVTIVPTIITHVHLTDQREWRSVDTRLIAWERDLAILVIWAKSWNNTEIQSWRSLDTIIERISIQVDDRTNVGGAAFNMYLGEINSENKVRWSLQNGTEVVFNLEDLGSDALIDNEEEVAFILSSEIPPLDAGTQESISIQLTSTDNGGIFVKSTDPSSITITDLNLRNRVTNRLTLID